MVGAGLFAVAIVHTFSTKFFEHLAHVRPNHAGLWHLLGEVEVVFGFWAMILVIFLLGAEGRDAGLKYLDSREFTEPMFVFAIMVIAGSRPILRFSMALVKGMARLLPLPKGIAFYFLALAFVPLLGSVITEPAAMTLAALMLRDQLFAERISTKLKYATLGVLFVNVSIGGVLTPFAAPPVLMVAGKWGWDIGFMFMTFGWKSMIAVMVNAMVAAFLFRREISRVVRENDVVKDPVPFPVVGVHLFFLVSVVIVSHHPAVFLALLVFFVGFASAYQKYQDRLIVREGLLVAFFLGGLVVLGGMQRWWLEPLLLGMSNGAVYYGATALTAVTDNAALTYLGSLAEGISDDFKYALVAGAVTGGGLTVIANAPNPAGFAILRGNFDEGAIHPLGLFIAALPATLVAIVAFRFF